MFTPNIKRKRGANLKLEVQPFPNYNSNEGRIFKSVFTGVSVEVFDKCDILNIYECGNYGKGSASRSAPQIITKRRCTEPNAEFDETLVLSLEEAFFLAYFVQVLEIRDLQKELITWQCFYERAKRIKSNFLSSLAAYVYLKSKNWIVKCGTKFGGDFLIYKKGIRFYHASFVVCISEPGDDEPFECKNMKGKQRVAESCGKDILLLQVIRPENFQLTALSDLKLLSVVELIVRRFNYTRNVQAQRKSKPNKQNKDTNTKDK